MVSQFTLPAAMYGKPPGHTSIPQGYRLLAKHSQIADQDCEILARIFGSFSWIGGGTSHCYPPCFGVWPLEGPELRLWVMRFLDVGYDDQSRPHSLRLEAGLVQRVIATEWPQEIARILVSSAWPKESLAIEPELTVTLSPVSPPAELARLIQEFSQDNQLKAVIVGDQRTFRTSVFQKNFDLPQPRALSIESSRASMTPSNPSSSITTSPRPITTIASNMLWLLLGIFLVGVPLLWWNYDLWRDLKTFQHEQGAIEQMRQEYSALQDKLQHAYQQLENKRQAEEFGKKYQLAIDEMRQICRTYFP
jgi:hypothetical protein